MAVLACWTPVNPVVNHDPGRATVSIHAYPMRLEMSYDEAARLRDQLVEALTGLAVKDGPAEVADRG